MTFVIVNRSRKFEYVQVRRFNGYRETLYTCCIRMVVILKGCLLYSSSLCWLNCPVDIPNNYIKNARSKKKKKKKKMSWESLY